MFARIQRIAPQFTRNMVTARAVVYSKYNSDPVLALHLHKHELADPKPDEVIVQAVAHPINPSDLNQVQGVYPSRPDLTLELGTAEPSAVAGNEGLFKVIAKGSNVTEFDVDDWCIPKNVNFGTWRSHALAKADKFVKLSKTISKNQAATIAVNPGTAYLMLTMFTDLEKGDWVVQNGANSAVGKFVIQIAKSLGINTLNVVRDRPEIEELKKELYDLGATKVITDVENESKDFTSTYKEWVGDSPVKLALNCVGGNSSSAIARKLTNGGYLVSYGGMSMRPVQIPTSLLVFKDIKLVGFWISEISKRDPEGKASITKKIVDLMAKGVIADFEVDHKDIDVANTSDEQFLKIYQDAIADSKKSKQLIYYD